MMRHSIFGPLTLALSLAGLGLSYILAGHWWIAAPLAGMILCWLLLRKWSVFRSATMILSVYMLLAAIGVYMDLAVGPLIVGATAALGSWDLILFSQELGASTPSSAMALMERSHLRWLVLAAGLGMSLAFIGLAMDLKLPFLLIASFVGLSMGGLVFGVRYFGRSTSATSEHR